MSIVELNKKTQFFFAGSVALLSVICYINSYQCDFVFDDASAIKSNKDIRPTTPIAEIFFNDFWGTSMTDERSHGSYRPLCTLTFRLNYMFASLDPMPYHVTNTFLHVIASVFVFFTLSALSFSNVAAWMASLLFSLHPIHTEAVTGAVGRAELLAAIFFLASFLFYVKSIQQQGIVKFAYLLVSLLCIPLSSLSKETGITVAGLLIIYEALVYAKLNPFSISSIKNIFNLMTVFRLSTVFATTCLFLFIRLKLMPQMPHFSILDNPAAHSERPTKQFTFAYLVPVNVHLLLYPWPLVADWALGTVPLVEDISDPRNLVTLIFFVAFFCSVFIVAKRTPEDYRLAVSFAMTIIPFIPASNLFFPVGFVVAERVLYLPSIGWCALVALGFERIHVSGSRHLTFPGLGIDLKSFRGLLSKIAVITLAAFLARSYMRNYDWSDQVSLFRAGLRFNQRNAKLFNNVGHTYEFAGKWEEAFAYFYKAVRTHPTDVGAHRNVARALKNMNHFGFAERALRRAIKLIPTKRDYEVGIVKTRVTPGHLDAFLDLAALLAAVATKDSLTEADELYGKVLLMRPDYLPAYERRGEIMFKLGKLEESRKMFRTGIQHNPQCGNCYYNLAVVGITESPNDPETLSTSLGLLDMAIQLDSEHHHAMHAFASIVQERRLIKLYNRAREYLVKVMDTQRGDIEKLKSQHMMPTTYPSPESVARITDVHFRAAMIETDLRNFPKALEYYKAALKCDPLSKSILFNVAWLLYKDLKEPLKSIPYLKKLIKAHPMHSSAWLLMGFVHRNHTKDYKKAKHAFQKAIEVCQQDPSQPNAATTISSSQYELCRLLEQENQPQHAMACLTQMQKSFPNDPVVKNEINSIRKRHPDLFN